MIEDKFGEMEKLATIIWLERQTEMDIARKHWQILQELETDLANRVREFMVIGKDGKELIVATENGEGYWIGEMRFRWDRSNESKTAMQQTLLDVPGLVHMAQGDRHILLLNKLSEIYSMGENDYGQLGLGTVNEETYFTPQLISIPQKFTMVRCGGWNCLALTKDGKVWAWGWNRYGQVGMSWNSADSVPFPRRIPELNSHQIVAIECGGGHSLALTDQGEVYGWGWNGYGQLGDGSWSSTHTPTQIPISSPVQSMAAGYSHTLLLTRTGEVYACGDNGCGQLGLPTTTETSASFVKVVGLPSISQIASHPDTHLSISMTSDQRCFVWGRLRDGTLITTPQELPPFYSTVESPLSFFSLYRNTPHSVKVPETPPSQNVVNL